MNKKWEVIKKIELNNKQLNKIVKEIEKLLSIIVIYNDEISFNQKINYYIKILKKLIFDIQIFHMKNLCLLLVKFLFDAFRCC